MFRVRLTYPRPLTSFFERQRCPDCGAKSWRTGRDARHDHTVQCASCRACFAVRLDQKQIERVT